MSVLFYNNAGRISVIRGAGLPAVVHVQGFRPTALTVSTVGISQRANVQIQPSLRRALYVYSFGDAVGSITLGGTAFMSQLCAGGAPRDVDGVEELMRFYSANRVSRSLAHVTVTVGRTPFTGFLVESSARSANLESRMFEWSMNLAAIPNFDGLAGAADNGEEANPAGGDAAGAGDAEGSGDDNEDGGMDPNGPSGDATPAQAWMAKQSMNAGAGQVQSFLNSSMGLNR